MSVDWFSIQEHTFTRWINDELKRRGMHIKDLKEDLKDGLILINLLEVISGKSLGRHNKHPRVILQKLENLNIAINFIVGEGLKLVNVGADDIHNGNMRIILGLIWTLVLRYEIKHGSDAKAMDDLLKWVQSKIPEQNITAFNGKNWSSGVALCALCEAVRPGTCPEFTSLNPEDSLSNCEKGVAVAESIGVDPLLLGAELAHPKVDRLAVMTYIAQFRNLPEDYVDAARCHAYGPGLVEGVMGEPTNFTVVKPPEMKCEIVVVVKDQDDNSIVVEKEASEEEEGSFVYCYTPVSNGTISIEIQVEEKDIPGSTFTAIILENESLGGEGRIRVFYSTTNSSQKGRADVFKLQKLLEEKKVHLRPDFEPWIPVDILSRDDREAVFRVAETRNLPIVFIDDKYTGDADEMARLNQSGELDKLLHMNKVQHELIDEEEHMARQLVTPRNPTQD